MILVDTSVWVNHLQRGNSGLAERLLGGLVCTRPHAVGELTLGDIKQRATALRRFSIFLLWRRRPTGKCLLLLTPTRCMEQASATSMFISWLRCS